ncbi:hypothetical protein HPP92_026074 [Vanilla planifolia]|uniref:Protein kinase domain-containing protein n=1 Tax=Vanilla planifolia TaxID=51239 RepID=A0A835PDG9_VANPL|nr:hypothetical protein HPP92_026074 [Vanilla planifolia]
MVAPSPQLKATISIEATSTSKPTAMKEIYLGRNPAWPTLANDPNSALDGSDSDSDSDDIFIPGLPTRFLYADLVTATDNFSTKIGSGGFGEVFKGVLPDNTEVAVKRISAGVGGSVRIKREFCTEIAVIGSIHHINLVRLRGFCAENRRRLLVYEYMNRGSLDRSLFGGPGAPCSSGANVWRSPSAPPVGFPISILVATALSSTATSSQRTSSSTTAAPSRSPISASPSS